MHSDETPKSPRLNVVLFSGGRGSGVLSRELINNPQISLTLAVNGYDDGASTGEVRRFLGDSLGPSDFRKNASRLAQELQSCNAGLIELLDFRFPLDCTVAEAEASFRIIAGEAISSDCGFANTLEGAIRDVDERSRKALSEKLSSFELELARTGRAFSFSDCSLGNLVFAGCFLDMHRDFNAAIADYCALLNLPAGLIENVTDGANAHLVALDHKNRILASEAEIVDAKRRNHIADIYLIDHELTVPECDSLKSTAVGEVKLFLEKHARPLSLNHRLVERIQDAQLIVYSPGTQHSSLFPSYLTPGLGTIIAQNLTAIKLLITNLQEDAEIPDSSAVDIIDRAVHYLKERNRWPIPTPCLITHYLINDPARVDRQAAYIQLGRLDTLEDPRLVRIGNYEEGITGRHDAAKILTPFIESILRKGDFQRIAVVLLDGESLNKVTQTILEMLRAGVQDLPVSTMVFYDNPETFDQAFTKTLPFEIRNVFTPDGKKGSGYLENFQGHSFDYVILFESSGMYRGEEIVALASILSHGKLDAVWGSRRLSVKDIHESYKLRYRHNPVLGAVSYIGSHALSLLYLFLYGRYIADTLSGVRAIRASYLQLTSIDVTHKNVNQDLLSLILRNRGEIIETPVQFLPISPEKVKRTTVIDGIRSLLTILWWRFRPLASLYHNTREIGPVTSAVASRRGLKSDHV